MKIRKRCWKRSNKLHGSCGYSGVPRLKTFAKGALEQQLRAGTPESELNRSSWSCWMKWIT